ncbi:MAG: YIP1 family protein [Deltaproteobacteria bacterium]|nr:YIP1 family protein [Deltaproteobacteria bacterium]MCB9787253.1 YIP1 family protein [Deltaproteobacteria bacterium]
MSESELTESPEGGVPEARDESFGRFVGRILRVMMRPSSFWVGMRQSGPPPLGVVFWPHLLVLIVLRSGADFVGGLLDPDVDLSAAISKATGALVAWVLLPVALGIVASIIGGVGGGSASFRRSMAFAGYGVTPLFIAGSLAVVPVPWVAQVAEMLAMPYAFYVLAVGVGPMLGVDQRRLAGAVGLVNGALVLLWSALALLSYWLLHAAFTSEPAAAVVSG